MRHLFGVRTCPNCPRCNHRERMSPCQDLFGSNAAPEGGVFGRVGACYVSIEAQKSTGALHAHCQVFVQRLRQRASLDKIFELVRGNADGCGEAFVKESLECKRWVCRQEHSARVAPAGLQKNLAGAEAAWPECKTEGGLVCRQTYQISRAGHGVTQQEEAEEACAWER
eukprot:874144-Pyramimonas_sp.AAC.1